MSVGHALVAIGPQLRSRLGVDELHGDAQPVAAAPHRAFDDVLDAELPADLAHVDEAALVGESRLARDDEELAHPRQRRRDLLDDAVDSAYGGFAGALYAPLVEFIDPAPFALGPSLLFLLMVVIGGSGSFVGPFIGAAVAVLLPEWLRFAEGYYLLIYAVMVIVLMAFCPTGIVGLVARLIRTWSKSALPCRPRRCHERGAGGARHPQGFRRRARRRRRVVRRARGRNPRAHRPQRLGQIDALQLHPRPARADAGRRARRRPARPGSAPVRAQPPRRQPHVPAAAGVPAAHGAREPDPRRTGAPGLHGRPAVRRGATSGSPPSPTA